MADARVSRESLAGRTVWRKRFGPTERAFARGALRLFANIAGLPALRAPQSQSAAQACATEVAMIARLQALGARVPEILERGETTVLLSDLGPTLASSCSRAAGVGEREALVRAGFAAISQLHERGGHLSQAFARNLTWQDGLVGFIDLEEDPGTVMPLVAAQARDLLLFVQSTARYFAGDPLRYSRLLREALLPFSPPARAEAARTARALRWLIPLAWPFGRRARAVAMGLQQLAKYSD